MVPRLLRLHPSTYQRLVRLSKEAEREGAYRVAKRLRAVVLNSEGHTSGALAEILQAPRSKVSEWLQRYQTAGVDGLLERVSVGPAIGDDREATATVRRYSRQRSGCLRSGYRHLDVAHDCLGDRGGVRCSVSSRPCAQIASRLGIFNATAPPRAGPRRRCGAGPMAPPHLSRP